MSGKNFLYNLKLGLICGMLFGTPIVTTSQKKSIWDKIESTPMSEKISIAQHNLDSAHSKNVYLVRHAACRYIKHNIQDPLLSDFMQKCVINDEYYYWSLTPILNPHAKEMLRTIKSDYKWFDDLMKYLSGRYTDEEFYKTGFFSVVTKPRPAFSATLYDIRRWRGFIERNSKQNENQR